MSAVCPASTSGDLLLIPADPRVTEQLVAQAIPCGVILDASLSDPTSNLRRCPVCVTLHTDTDSDSRRSWWACQLAAWKSLGQCALTLNTGHGDCPRNPHSSVGEPGPEQPRVQPRRDGKEAMDVHGSRREADEDGRSSGTRIACTVLEEGAHRLRGVTPCASSSRTATRSLRRWQAAEWFPLGRDGPPSSTGGPRGRSRVSLHLGAKPGISLVEGL